MKIFLICISILLIFPACEDSSTANNGDTKDTSPDFQKNEDVKTSQDTANSDASADASLDTKSNVDAALDSATDLSDASVEDARVDLGDPFPGRPKGQCQQKSDCPVQPNAACGPIPGGACLNCAASDANCPGDASCSQFGACTVDCQSENDCAPGLRCTGVGRCAPQRCEQDVCPTPGFGCTDSGLCERKSCADDVNACDAGTTCLEGRCVLNR